MQKADTQSQQEEIEVHLTKNRIAAVDIARILAAFAVMVEHLHFTVPALDTFPGQCYLNFCHSYSCLFFVFAGYFACRNITWKKAVHNAWWCLVPFLIWNTIEVVLTMCFQPELIAGLSIVDLYAFNVWEYSVDSPLDDPIWFIRNLIYLYLLSPVVFKYSKFIFPALLIASVFPIFSLYFAHEAPFGRFFYSLAFFAFGCWLRSFPKEMQQKCLQSCNKGLLLFYTFATVIMTAAYSYGWLTREESLGQWSFVHELVGLIMVYQIARCIELYSPFLTRVALTLAPVTFLTFATHWIIFQFCEQLPLSGTNWPLLLPPAAFIVLALLFFAMKRWARPLLLPVAHYKLRPDDLHQIQKQN